MKRKTTAEHNSAPPNFALDHHAFGLDDTHLALLSRRLQVPLRVTLAETIAYAASCRLQRSEHVPLTTVAEIWDSLGEHIKQRNKQNPEARLILFGANPRNPNTVTNATTDLPHTTQFLTQYILTLCPTFRFNAMALRLNDSKAPHVDHNNGPEDSFMMVVTPCESGGNLWIAEASGDVFLRHQDTMVAGRIHNCQGTPLLFPGKTRLHATEAWTGERRLVLLAWSTLTLDKDANQTLATDYMFPVPSRVQTSNILQLSLKQTFAKSQEHVASSASCRNLTPMFVIPSSPSEATDPESQPTADIRLSPQNEAPIEPDKQNNSPKSSSSFASTIQEE